MHLTVTSLQCQCLTWLMIDQGNLMLKPKPDVETQTNKNPKTNHKETTIEREKPVWFWAPRMVARIQGKFGGWWNSIAGRLSRQFFSWSFFRADNKERREDLGKHNVHTHFPEDPNCEICKRTKITRAPHAEDAMAKPYFVPQILVTW